MKTLLITIISLIWAGQAFTQDYFSNLREGQSRFISEVEKPRIEAMIKKHGRGNLTSRFTDMFQDKNIALCASAVVKKLSWLELDEVGRESLALTMRELNIIDDIVLDKVLIRNRIKFEESFPSMRTGSVKEDEIEESYKKFSERLSDGACAEDAFIDLARSMWSKGYNKNGKFKATNSVAKKKGFVTEEEFELLESFRRAKVHFWKLTLKGYSRKLRALRRQVDRYGNEESLFVTQMNKKAKTSYRQYLFENYDYMQILMMGNLLEKMRKRLDSADISIIIRYADDEQTEVIPLEPTERFRFVLKLLRKEMAKLKQSNLFDEERVPYVMVIAAAYEVGAVPGIELDELASLEEIWNPTRTRMDRIMSWARMFGGVASVVIPGPFAFLPVLAVMVVDGLTDNPKPESDQNISLF